MPDILRVGDVVRRSAKSPHQQDLFNRGVVIFSGKPGDLRHHNDPVGCRYGVYIQPGLTIYSDVAEWWDIVPDAECTAEERVHSASLTYQPWRSPEDGVWEPDSYEYQLVEAMLPPAEQDYLAISDVPSFFELARMVARMVDGIRESSHEDLISPPKPPKLVCSWDRTNNNERNT